MLCKPVDEQPASECSALSSGNSVLSSTQNPDNINTTIQAHANATTTTTTNLHLWLAPEWQRAWLLDWEVCAMEIPGWMLVLHFCD